MLLEREIYGWIYSYNGNGFNIIPNESFDHPQILYKLYALNQFSFDSLINQYVYATHPSQFNDIFDCNEELLDFDNDSIRIFLKDFFTKEKLERLIKEDIVNLRLFTQRLFREILYKKWGVFSMTGNPNNILMWSYYSHHSGFCIEFDISKFPFKFFGPFPVNYQPTLEAISLKNIGLQIGVLAQCNLKDEIWKHEQEWRLMIAAPDGEDMVSKSDQLLKGHDGHNRKFHYPLEAIQSISLGNRFFIPDEIKEINSRELEINLMSDIKRKSKMLSFLSKNKIKTHIGLRVGFTEIKFKVIEIQKVGYKKFLIK